MDTPTAQPDLKIRAVAGQFQWQFDYMPDDYDAPADGHAACAAPLYQQFAPTGEDGGLNVPTGRTVQLYLTSPDVIHAFYVPQFLFKRDVVPGRVNQFDFKVDDNQAGQTFRGQCAELCGAGHRIMLFEVHAMTGADFDAWLAEQGRSGQRLAAAGAVGACRCVRRTAAGRGPAGRRDDHGRGGRVHDSPTSAPRPAARSRSTSTTRTRACRTTSRSSRARPAARWSSTARSSRASPPRTYDVRPLPAGTYPFECFVHPTMTGTLTVK